MKAFARYGQVHPDSVRVLTLTVETQEDAQVLRNLHRLFCLYPSSWTEAQRLCFAVLGTFWDRTIATALVDEVQESLASEDVNQEYVSRTDLLRAIERLATLHKTAVDETAGQERWPAAGTLVSGRLGSPVPVSHNVYLAMLDVIALWNQAQPKKVKEEK